MDHYNFFIFLCVLTENSRIGCLGDMVNKKKLRKLLPTIFTEGDPRYKNRQSEYQSKKRKLRQLERKRMGFFAFQMNRAAKVFREIEKALNEDIEW